MKRTIALLMLVVLYVGLAVPSFGATLGDDAAPLYISKWLKGDAVSLEALKGKKVLVVEFWATWCPPCLQSIPHLTAVQAKYKKDVVIVGVSDEKQSVVDEFVKKMGSKMDYHVALDDEGKTSQGYMKRYGATGIPHAFIVDRKGRVVFEGHPMNALFEDVLGEVVAGTFDIDSFRAEEKKRKDAEEKLSETHKRYMSLASGGGDKALIAKTEGELQSLASDSPYVLNSVAWTIATEEGLKHRNLEFALTMADKACELTGNKNAGLVDTRARVLFELGRIDEAIATQKKAVALGGNDRERASLGEALAEYEAGARKAADEK